MRTGTRLDVATLTTLVEGVANIDCAGATELVEVIAQLERLKNASAAAQARAAAELRDIRTDEATASARSTRRVAAAVAGEVGLARRESPHRAAILVGLAAVLPELPRTSAAFRAGEVTEWQVTVLARETACLSRAHRAEVDAELGPELARMSTRQIGAAARHAAYRLDPHGVVARIGRAEAERRVTSRPAPDCMSWVSALLPAADGVAIMAALTKAADAARTAGDPRSKSQVMADTLVARATGKEPAEKVGVEIQLVMTDEALLTNSDTPARLNDYGPIPADVARRIAEAAISTDSAWLRRLYAPPGEGRLVGMESTRRRFPKGMRAFIKTRDEVCRTPFCGAPIRHTDHVISVRAGGTTSLTNGQGLCERCNYLKEEPGWQTTPMPNGSIVTRTPTGHEYASRPPDLPHEPRRPRERWVDFPVWVDLVHSPAA